MTNAVKFILLFLLGVLCLTPVDAQNPTTSEMTQLISENKTWKIRRIEADGQMFSVPAEMQGKKMVFQNDKNFFFYQPSQSEPISIMNFMYNGNTLISYSNTEYHAYEVQLGDVVTQIKLRELSDPVGAFYVWEPADEEATDHYNFLQPNQSNSFYNGTTKANDLIKKINSKMKIAEGNFFFYESGEIPIVVQKHEISLDKSLGVKISYVLSKKEDGKLPTYYSFTFSPKDIKEVIDLGTHKDSPLGIARVKFYAHTGFRSDYTTKDDLEKSGVNYVNVYFLNIRENSFQEMKDYLLALKKENEEHPGKLDQFFDHVTTDTFWESYEGTSNKYTLINGGVLSNTHFYLTYKRNQIKSDGKNSENGYLVKIPASSILYFQKPEANKADPFTKFPMMKDIGVEYYQYDDESEEFKPVGNYGMRFPIFMELDEEDDSLITWIKYLFEHLKY